MNTIVISAFPGTGKSWAAKNCNNFSIIDSDSSSYKKEPGWEDKYAEFIESKLDTVDFIFVSQHDGVRAALQKRGIQFCTVAPEIDPMAKEIYIGRWLLRDNSHIKDLNQWMKLMVNNYDRWVSNENQEKYGALFCLRLPIGTYLNDYLTDLHNVAYLRNVNYNFQKLTPPEEKEKEAND